MSRVKNIISIVLPLLPLLLYSQSDYILSLAGRVQIDKARLVRWENSSALNSDDCQVIRDANACEDVKIHYASSTAFLACGDPFERTHWYPCAGVRMPSRRAESSFREQLFKHDLKTGKTTELELRGFEGDFINHGIDIFPIGEGFSKIRIFAVNHARDGDSIAIFDHEIGSDAVQLVKNVKHPNIKTANGVAAVGPTEFYLTNDHYFAGGPGRTFEETFGPWSWATHVQYCEAASGEVSCRQVTDTYPGANGINVWKDRLFVGDSQNGTLRIFDIHDDKSLSQLQMIVSFLHVFKVIAVLTSFAKDLGAAADNINILPTSGDPIVAVFPTLEDLPKYLRDVKSLGTELLVPAAALRLDSANDYTPSLAYYNDGSAISFMTAAAVDPYNDVFIGAGVLQYGGFAVCKVRPGTFA